MLSVEKDCCIHICVGVYNVLMLVILCFCQFMFPLLSIQLFIYDPFHVVLLLKSFIIHTTPITVLFFISLVLSLKTLDLAMVGSKVAPTHCKSYSAENTFDIRRRTRVV